MSFIRRIPIPMSALALGLACLGNLLLPYSPVIRSLCGAASAVLVLLLITRAVLDFQDVRGELENPAMLAVVPAFFMAVMVLATYLKPYAAAPAKGLWAVALVAQLAVVVLFTVRFVGTFKLAQVLPGWFIVFVGFVTATVTSPAFDAQPVGRILLYAGLLGYVGVLLAVVYRMVKVGALPAPALPTVAIFAAPPSLCLVGYLAVTQVKDAGVVYALLAAAAVSVLYVLVSLPRVLKTPFSPVYAALTFPFVITGIALKQSSAFLATTEAGSFIPKIAVTTMDAIAALVVLYVFVRYAAYLASPARAAVPAAVQATT